MNDFIEDFLKIYTKDDLMLINEYIDSVWDDKDYSNEIWEFSHSVEKIHALQEVYHFTFVKNEDYDNIVCMSLAQGVDNCSVVDYDFEGRSELDNTATRKILKDVVMNKDKTKAFLTKKGNMDVNWSLVSAIFDDKKGKILELYSKMNYDDYVTGGGTLSTDSHYKKEFQKLKDMGIFWDCIYEFIEVDRNML